MKRLVALSWLLAAGTAAAARPTDPGALFAYTPDDVLAFFDAEDADVRVHYSTSGPSKTIMADGDGDGVPDFVKEVAGYVAGSLAFYESVLGLRPPLGEADVGLADLGGSGAFDVYLVDFGGMGDGHFTLDGCTPPPVRCGGAFLMENDFAGYGYPTPYYAAELVASHELLHAIQAAYAKTHPVWFSEGTAVWGSARYGQGGMSDLLGFGADYLADCWRTLYKPPGGPVPAFAYGTALWFDFLALRHGDAIVAKLLEATEGTSGDDMEVVEGIVAVLESHDDTLAAVWPDFAAWNLATGKLAGGGAESYPYAAKLSGIAAETDGAEVDDVGRFYPLGARFYRLHFGGGPLYFGLAEATPGVWFSVHPETAAGKLEPSLARWEGAEAASFALLDGEALAAGGYWLAVANARTEGQSSKVRVCLGTEALASGCAPPVAEPGPEPGADLAPEPSPAVEPGADAGPTPDGADTGAAGPPGPQPGGEPAGGGCSSGRVPAGPGALVLVLVATLAMLLGCGRDERVRS